MIDPVAVQIGPIQVHWYGIILATAILVAGVLASRVAAWLGENPDDGWSMLLLVVALAVLGARLYHVIHLWGYYSARPIEIPQVWNGGLGIPGAVAGGALGVLIGTRRRGLHTARWIDIFASGMLLGQAVGRLGNFVNQELYGPPTTLPWGIPIDAAHRIGAWTDLNAYPVDSTRFHPLFAYEALLNLVGLVVLLVVVRRYADRLFAGDLLLMYLMWYSAVRTALEPFRIDNWTIAGVPTAIWLGILTFLLALGWLVIRHRRGWGSPMLRPADDAGPFVASGTASQTEVQPGPEATPG